MGIGTVDSVAFHFLGIPIYWYAIIIVSGMMLGTYLATQEAQRLNMDKDIIVDFMLWAIPISLLCARIYYVIFEWGYYQHHLSEIFAIRHGGIAIYGGLIGGAITAIIYTKYQMISIWSFLDIAAPSVIIAQAIGRWGNFMNQEAYGPITDRSFLEQLHLPKFIIENMYIENAFRHPTFLYESVWNLLGFCLLIFLRKFPKLLKQGEIALSYVLWYSFGRFFIEGLRTDSLMFMYNIRISQLLSAVFFIGALIIWAFRRYKYPNLPYYSDLRQTR